MEWNGNETVMECCQKRCERCMYLIQVFLMVFNVVINVKIDKLLNPISRTKISYGTKYFLIFLEE